MNAQAAPQKKAWFDICAFVFLFCVVFAAHLSSFTNLGLYEDDYLFTLPPANWDAAGLGREMHRAVTTWPQGRPGWWVLNPALAWVCGQTGSLIAHHVALALAITLASYLLFRLCRRFTASGPALGAALLFALAPADGSKPIIMHATNYFVVLSITFGALSVYLSRWRAWSYPIAAVVLLTYEPYFLFFGLFPFVACLLGRERVGRRTLIHWGILAITLVSILLIRRHMGESRSGELLTNLVPFLKKALSAPFIGTWTSVKMLALRPWDALCSGDGPAILVAALAFTLLGWLYNPFRGTPALPQQEPAQAATGKRLWLLGALGLAFILVPYLYRWHPDYYPPIVTVGRLSALHIPSAVGVGIICAACLEACRLHIQRFTSALNYIFLTYCALLVAVSFHIQQVDYVRNREQQQAFWRQLIALTADAGEDAIILVNIELPTGATADPRPCTRGLPPFWLAVYSTNFLETIFVYPPEWRRPPRVHAVWNGMASEGQPDGLLIQSPVWLGRPFWPILQNGNFIWLEWSGTELVRRDAAVELGGRNLIPKPIGPKLPPPRQQPAYELFFPDFTPEWPSIRDARNYPS